MARKFEYTTLAHRYTARFPRFAYVGTQVNFWILANIFLVVISHLQSRIVSDTYGIAIDVRIGSMIVMAILLGLLYGICLGFTGYYLDRSIFRRYSLGRLIVFKTIVSVAVLILILALLRFILFDPIIYPSLHLTGSSLNRELVRAGLGVRQLAARRLLLPPPARHVGYEHRHHAYQS